jgi:hypothetical protein
MYAEGEGKPVRHETYPNLIALKAGVWRTLEQLHPGEVLDVRFKERPYEEFFSLPPPLRTNSTGQDQPTQD